MATITESQQIAGIKHAHLKSFGDDRGRFLETFRTQWFPERSWAVIQSNRSDSNAGVLRGLHYHFRQVDYWYVLAGRVRIGLADLRRTSPTYGVSQILEVTGEDNLGFFIPVGVAHGYYALTTATIVYTVDQYYDGSDELGVAWNDPTLALPWGISDPILSARDQQNPRLQDIAPALRPE